MPNYRPDRPPAAATSRRHRHNREFGIIGRRYAQVGDEAQHVGFAVAQALQEQPAGWLLGIRPVGGSNLGSPTRTPSR